MWQRLPGPVKQAGMAVESHDDEIAAEVHGASGSRPDIAIGSDFALQGHPDAMLAKPGGDIGARNGPMVR
jgi:hypothetical protein